MLIKAVIQAIPSYAMAMVRFPKIIQAIPSLEEMEFTHF